MKMMRSLLLGSMLVAGLVGTSSAFAASQWLVGGSTNGTSTVGPGATNLSLGTANFPCTSTFTVVDTGGVLQVTNAVFTGGGACALIKPSGLPWPVSGPSGTGPWTGTVSGVTVSAAGLFNCSGNVTVTVATNGDTQLSGTLAPGCGISSSLLPSAPPISAL